MKAKIHLLCLTGILLFFAACSDETELLNKSASAGKDVSLKNFPYAKWWAYFPREVKSDSYTAASGPDGLSWPGLYTSFRFFPDYVHAIYHAQAIHMVYYHQSQLAMHHTPDGLNWTTGEAISSIDMTSAPGGKRNFPRIATVDFGLYAYIMWHGTNGSRYMLTYQYINGSFQKLSQVQLNSGSGALSPPCLVKLGSTYYIMYTDVQNSALKYMTSADGINWSSPSTAYSSSTFSTDIDAVVFKDNIYVSYRRVDDKGLAYVKFNGSSAQWYTNINHYKSQGANCPMATDGQKLVMSFRDGSNTGNRFVYTYDGLNWYLLRTAGSSGKALRTLVYTGIIGS